MGVTRHRLGGPSPALVLLGERQCVPRGNANRKVDTGIDEGAADREEAEGVRGIELRHLRVVSARRDYLLVGSDSANRGSQARRASDRAKNHLSRGILLAARSERQRRENCLEDSVRRALRRREQTR